MRASSARAAAITIVACVFAGPAGCSEQPETGKPDVAATPTPPAAAAVSVAVGEGGRPPETYAPEPPAEGPTLLDLAAGEALAVRILANIKADPRITSRDVQVRYLPPQPGSPTASISLSGTAASDEENFAARNHVFKMTDLGLSGSLNVIPPPEADAPPPPWTGPAAGAPVVPLCAGLTVVTAVASQGDYESIKTVESITDAAVRLKYSSQPNRPWWSAFHSKAPATVTTHRTVLKEDLESARRYHQIFVQNNRTPETAPGATAIGTSAAVLRDLKTKGEAELSMCTAADDIEIRDSEGGVRLPPGGCLDYTSPMTLRRVGATPVKLELLLNGVATELPAVQARGYFAPGRFHSEFFFLDDERNPLTLAFRLGIGTVPALQPALQRSCDDARKGIGSIEIMGDPPSSCDLPDGGDRDQLRVVSISTRCDLPASAAADGGAGAPGVLGGAAGGGRADGGRADAIEKALAAGNTLDIYSIYFEFNSDTLREESEPTLEDIATVLRRNQAWTMRVNGHTDGIGTEAFNLDLSRRRAAAVKAALVARYGIDARRLDTSGAGESRPKDTNETVEGRARNRRVELMKGS